jgi:hypothetical protein
MVLEELVRSKKYKSWRDVYPDMVDEHMTRADVERCRARYKLEAKQRADMRLQALQALKEEEERRRKAHEDMLAGMGPAALERLKQAQSEFGLLYAPGDESGR